MNRIAAVFAALLLSLPACAQVDRKLQDMPSLAAPASNDLAYVVDVSASNASRKITLSGLNAFWQPATSQLLGIMAMNQGGTGASLVDPNADRIGFWDDSAGAFTWLTAGSGLSISGTTLNSTATGTVTSVAATAPTAGFTISGSPITTTGTLGFTLADDLAALEGLSGTGLARRTGTSAWTVGSAVNLATEVTGVAGVPNGGTGGSSAAAARTALDVQQADPYLSNIAGLDDDDVDCTLYRADATDDIRCAHLGQGIEIVAGAIQVPDGIFDWNSKTPPVGTVAGLSDTQTFTNKTYAAPVLDGHVTSTGTALSAANLSHCGTGPTIDGNDRRGTVTLGAGATECYVNFAASYSTAPFCVLGNANNLAGPTVASVYAVSTNTLQIGGEALGGGEMLTYICEE